jgi:VIT1/CCC1 family predicted Fe2+/Mn2+ transporter
MTTHATTRPGRPVTPRAAGHHTTVLRDHTVTGTPAQLANLIANHRNAGILVALTAPRPVTADLFQVVIRLRETTPTRPLARVTSVGAYARTRARRSRRTRLAVIVTAITGTTAGLLAVTAYLLGQLVELIVAHAAVVLTALALAAVLAGLTGHRRASRRRHCPGC